MPRTLLLLVIAFLASPLSARAQDDTSAATALRAAFFDMDFERGVLEGQPLVEAGTSTEVLAWYLLNLALDQPEVNAVEEARALVDSRPDDPWAWFARAGTAMRLDDGAQEADAASARALSLAPHHPDVRYLRADVLRTKVSPDAALAFIDSLAQQDALTSDLLVVEARALYEASGDYTPDVDQAMIDSSYATFARVRSLDSTNVLAFYEPAKMHERKRHAGEAYALLERAYALSPLSAAISIRYGNIVLARNDLSKEEKHARIDDIIDRLLEGRPHGPAALYAAASLFGDIEDRDGQRMAQERLLEVEPQGTRAEWTLLGRIRRFRHEHDEKLYGEGSNPAMIAEYKAMLEAFLDRGWHVDDGLLGETYLNLFYMIRDTGTADEIHKVVEGMVTYEELNPHITYVMGSIALAKHGFYRKAEEVARAGNPAMRAQVEGRRSMYSQEQYESALRYADTITIDALGWVYFLAGRLDDAEQQLAHAYDLSEGKSRDVLYHLGRLYEARYDAAAGTDAATDVPVQAADVDAEALYQTAFNYYQSGKSIQGAGDNPSDAALEALYEKHNGSLEGFDGYLASLEAENTEARKEAVLASRLEAPRAPAPFDLERLFGGRLSTEDLTGKVAVINMWYTGCGPCIIEMPDLQKLHERYDDEPDVLVLTINKDYNPDDARDWATENGLTMPILIDDGYLDQVNVHAYPTTWFIDRDGTIAFEKIGWTKHLVEEFSWRIEALR